MSATTNPTGGAPGNQLSPAANAMAAAIVRMLGQNSNGDGCYDNDKVAVGYIPADKFLLVPMDFYVYSAAKDHVDVDLAALGKRFGSLNYMDNGAVAYRNNNAYLSQFADYDSGLLAMKISALNYMSLKAAGLTAASAFVCATLRARWCVTRALEVVLPASAATTIDITQEIIPVSPSDPMYGPIVAATTPLDVMMALGPLAEEFAKEGSSTTHGTAWVLEKSENIWAAVEHCFRVRGHHYKTGGSDSTAFENLYRSYLTAAFAGNDVLDGEFDLFDVFHTAIHPFKIKALPVMAAHYLSYGKLANASILRMSGAPIGNALITTCYAALSTMRGEAWFAAFEAVYQEPIAAVKAFSDSILNNRYGYHLCANLYGVDRCTTVEWNGKVFTIDEAKMMISSIAAACQGMITGLEDAVTTNEVVPFSLRNAKALKKAAADAPLIAFRVRELVVRAVTLVSEAKDLNTMIQHALPDYAALVANRSAAARTPGGPSAP